MKTILALLAVAPLALAGCSSSLGRAPEELVGTWSGEGRIIVTWCEAERLPIELEIHDDASVTGTIGDAALSAAALRRNRGALAKEFELATDWIVVADLEGPLVAAEGIRRGGVKLPFDLEQGELHGGLHSTGAHVGDRETMVLSATDVVLRRR